MKTFLLVLVLSFAGCATQHAKANLAIDSEPTPLPEKAEEDNTTTTTEDTPPDGEIDLGFEGGTHHVRVDHAMSAEEEEAALAADEKADEEEAKDGDKKKSDEAKDDEAADDEEVAADDAEAADDASADE